jgi:hypothetical protein
MEVTGLAVDARKSLLGISAATRELFIILVPEKASQGRPACKSV